MVRSRGVHPRGLNLVEQCLGLLPTESETPPLFVQEGVILVFVDLEIHGIGTSKCEKEITSLGIVAFDTRKFLLSLSQSEKEKLIETVQVSRSRDTDLSVGGNGKLFILCVFGPTLEAMAYDWSKFLTSAINTMDDQDQDRRKFRKVLLVGTVYATIWPYA